MLFLASVIGTLVQLYKENHEPVLTADYFANDELYSQDIINGVPYEKRMKNLKNGKYRLTEKYPEPHRNPKTGKIVIENCLLYNSDVREYGAYQASKWAEQGKYNLTQEELENEIERIKKENGYR